MILFHNMTVEYETFNMCWLFHSKDMRGKIICIHKKCALSMFTNSHTNSLLKTVENGTIHLISLQPIRHYSECPDQLGPFCVEVG